MVYTVAGLRSYYLSKFNSMVITRPGAINAAARKIVANKARYREIEDKTGVPWKVIGCIHLRESDCNFNTHLHNGDPLTARTYHVPAGRPLRGRAPFKFEDSAIDALQMQGATKIKEWTIEQTAFFFEAYNGWGYRYRGIPSAYLWSGSNQYSSGKYIADGVFSATTVDEQLGVMCVIKVIMDMTGEPLDSTPNEDIPTIAVDSSLPPHQNVAIPGGKASPPPVTSGELAATSRKYFWTQVTSVGTKIGIGFLGLVQAIDLAAIQATQSFVSAIKGFISENGVYLALMALIAYALYTRVLKDWMKQDVAEGRSVPSGVVPVAPATEAPCEVVPEVVQPLAAGAPNSLAEGVSALEATPT